MTLPNALTSLRILFIPLLVTLLLLPGYRIASVVLFAILALSDLIDGMLARWLKQRSVAGALFDPLADKILVISTLMILVELGELSSIPVIIIVARELLVTGLRVLIAAKKEVMPASLSGKWKTVFQMIAAFMLIMNIPYGLTVLWIAVILTVISGIEYFWGGRKYLNG